MKRSLKILSVLVAVLAGSITVVACGTSGGGKTGGTVRILTTSYPDYLDPGLSYTVEAWQPLLQVYPGLVVFPHKSGDAGNKPEPGLAESLPKITNGGKTYELTLRKNLVFSDDTPIKASDFKKSIERLFVMDSQGLGLGYTNIVGAPQFQKTKKGGLKGIVINDKTGEITINLIKRRGPFTYELAIPFAAIVPGDTPAKNMTKNPPPAAGRYMVVNVDQGRSYELVPNPHFSPDLKGTAIDAGKVTKFHVDRIKSESQQVDLISRNRADFMIDNPPADRVAEVKSQYENKRFDTYTVNSVYYFFMNTEAPPFNSLKARQAVNYAVDFDAISRLRGGFLAPTNDVLPPGVPGHKDWPNLYPHNVAKAKQLIQQAGVKGHSVTVWGDDDPTTARTTQYYADLLNQIGFKAKPKIISADTYFATIGDRSLKAQTGFTDWFQDYPHPADFLDVLVNPDNVVATGNNNYSYNAGDKKLASMINDAVQKQLDKKTEDEWANIDRYVQEKAYWAMYGNQEQSTFFSDRMDFGNCKGQDWPVGNADWAQFCLK